MKFNFSRFIKHAVGYFLLGILTILLAGMLIESGTPGFVIAIVLAVGWGVTPAAITETLLSQYKK